VAGNNSGVVKGGALEANLQVIERIAKRITHWMMTGELPAHLQAALSDLAEIQYCISRIRELTNTSTDYTEGTENSPVGQGSKTLGAVKDHG